MFFQSSDWLSGYWMSVVIVCPPQMVDNNRLASSSQNEIYNISWHFVVAYVKTVTIHLRFLKKLMLAKNSPLRVLIDNNGSETDRLHRCSVLLWHGVTHLVSPQANPTMADVFGLVTWNSPPSPRSWGRRLCDEPKNRLCRRANPVRPTSTRKLSSTIWYGNNSLLGVNYCCQSFIDEYHWASQFSLLLTDSML